MRPRLRRHWRVLHRWVGLTFGCLLLAAAITGCLLVVARPLDVAMHPKLFRPGGGPPVPLQAVVSRLRTEFGPDAAFDLRLPGSAEESLQIAVNGGWRGTVYVDPGSGGELGRRASGQGFFSALFEFHSSLYAGDGGRAVLAWAALAYCAMLLSGLALWWPARWRDAISVRIRGSALVTLSDLHRVAGAALGLLVLVSVLTGAYMAWKPLAAGVTYLAGRSPTMVEPAPPAPVAPSGPAVATTPIDAAVRRARDHWPGAVVSVVHVPPRSLAAARVRLRLADDPHPIGMSTIWLHPASGQVHAARRWSELDPGLRAFSTVYPLHTGRLAGSVTLLATFASGVALICLGCTGLWLWWRRNGAR